MKDFFRLPSIEIQGYRPFDDVVFLFKKLQVIVGANGSGKSSLFEFLKFLRDACHQEIPPEIINGAVGRQVFHKPGPEKFSWSLEANSVQMSPVRYRGELMGPAGSPMVTYEKVTSATNGNGSEPEFDYLDFQNGKGFVQDHEDLAIKPKEWNLQKRTQLGLGAMTDSTFGVLFNLREFIRGWRFYSTFAIDNEKIRKSVPIEQTPVLREDAGNLSAILFNLMTESPENFEELKSALKSAIPGFKNLNVKARGGPGEVIAFWREENIDTELSLADLSDGVLRFIAWAALSVSPSPPSLICIDEPDQGVHPRTLPILAGLFEKASERTQLILTTHASYFLSQFKLNRVAILKKRAGEIQYVRVEDSRTLLDNLEDFGVEELELMHRTDELEALA